MRPGPVRLSLAACLLLSGCGLRVDHSTRQALLNQSLRGGSGTAQQPNSVLTTTGPTQAPGGSGPVTTATTGPVAGSSGTVTGSTGAPVVGSSAPAGGNGGATDIGVTSTTITVGTVADETGPQPGLFDGDIAGARAYFAYVNSQGGVNGRTISTKVADSQLDCNQTANAYSSLAPSIFSFVSNLSNYDNCGATVLKAHPTLPDVSFTLTPEHTNAPATFSAQPLTPGARTGPPKAFAAAFPEVKGAVGGLYPNVASAKAQWTAEKAMLQSIGFTIAYEQAVPPTEVDYTQYVIGMRQKNVKMAILFNTAANNEKFLNAAQQQSFDPPVIESPGTFYDPSLKEAVGTKVTDLYDDFTTALYTNEQERTIPGVALYQTWMRKAAPDQARDEFSVFGWMNAALFVQAVRDAGAKLTRAGLIAALKRIHHFDAGGLIASGDPGSRKPVSCYLLGHYVNGTWQRWNSPASGFRCDAPYYFVRG